MFLYAMVMYLSLYSTMHCEFVCSPHVSFLFPLTHYKLADQIVLNCLYLLRIAALSRAGLARTNIGK